jgi:hypothetical protein
VRGRLFSVSYAWQLNGDFNPVHVSDWAARQVFLKSSCKSQFPHKYVKVFFILVIVKDKLTGLWGG